MVVITVYTDGLDNVAVFKKKKKKMAKIVDIHSIVYRVTLTRSMGLVGSINLNQVPKKAHICGVWKLFCFCESPHTCISVPSLHRMSNNT